MERQQLFFDKVWLRHEIFRDVKQQQEVSKQLSRKQDNETKVML